MWSVKIEFQPLVKKTILDTSFFWRASPNNFYAAICENKGIVHFRKS
jgi:hypothetical protein